MGLESSRVFSFWTKRILFCFTTCLSSDGLRTILTEVDEQEMEMERVVLGVGLWFLWLMFEGLRDCRGRKLEWMRMMGLCFGEEIG